MVVGFERAQARRFTVCRGATNLTLPGAPANTIRSRLHITYYYVPTVQLRLVCILSREQQEQQFYY